jgi:hypothetical protein
MLFRDYRYFNIRAAAILTNSYVAGTIIAPYDSATAVEGSPQYYNQLVVYVAFTIGSLTNADIKVEFSHDGTTYHQESFSSVSGGTDTVTVGIHRFGATGNFRILIPLKDNYVKISAIGNGTVTSSSMTINAVLGVV